MEEGGGRGREEAEAERSLSGSAVPSRAQHRGFTAPRPYSSRLAVSALRAVSV